MDNRPVRVKDTVRILVGNKGFQIGTFFKVETLNVLSDEVGIRHRNGQHKRVSLKDIEVVSSPEWQLKLL